MCRDQYREYACWSNDVKGLRMVPFFSDIPHLTRQVQTEKTISMTARFRVLRECKILIRIPCVNWINL